MNQITQDLGTLATDTYQVYATSSYNLHTDTGAFSFDQAPSAVSKNGSSNFPTAPYNCNHDLTPITNYMILKITVNDAGVATFASYPNYQIGKNDGQATMDFYVAEIIGYDHALVTADSNALNTYLYDKDFVAPVASGYTSWATTHVDGQAANLDYNNDGVQNGVCQFIHNSFLIATFRAIGGFYFPFQGNSNRKRTLT